MPNGVLTRRVERPKTIERMRLFDTLRQWVARTGTLISLVLAALGAQATTYYVSPTGNDANNGTSQNSAWQTIDRVNQSTYSIQPGDQILFQRGGHYRGEIIWGTSGTPAAPVTYGAYGSGDDPIIDGSRIVTNWVQHSGNVWKAQVGTQVDQVYVGGARSILARTPNTGWYRNDQGSGTSMHSNSLTEANGFWTGARCVLRNTASSIDTLRVTGFNNGTLTFSYQPINGNMGTDDWGFYLEKRLDLLDAPNEWFYEASSGYLYLQAPNNANPNNITVEACTAWAGIWCYPGRHDMVADHLHFRHQRNAGVRVDDASYVTVQNCTMEDSYHGIRSYGHHNLFSHNTIRRTLATGCLMIDHNSVFEYNDLEDIATIAGEGESGWGYFGIRGIGVDNVIRGNRFENIGYIAIVADANHLIEKNVIHHYLTTLNDGGAIAFDETNGLTIQDNIMYDAVCNLDGSSTVMPHYQPLGLGIYFGTLSNENVIVRRNTVANLTGVGINVDHNMNSHGYQVRDNTIFNCGIGMSISDFSNSNGPNASYPYYVANYDDVYSGNIIYGLNKDQLTLRFYNCYSPLPTDFGTYTNNRYFNPYNEMGIFVFSFQAGQYYWSLERWQAEKGEEAGSTRSPLRLNEWTTVSELSGNQITSGDFSSGVSTWASSVWPTNAQITQNAGHLDNGCMKVNLPDNTVYGSCSLRNPEWFTLQNGQNDWYRLDLSLQSDEEGYLLAGIKGESQMQNPYTLYERLLPFGPERRDLSLYFQSANAEQAQLMLLNQWTEPMYYIDNVQLHKVQVQAADPLETQMVLINDQITDRTFDLEGCWSDVNGQYFSGSITLQAFKSKVLVREDDALCGLSMSVEDQSTASGRTNVYPNPVKGGGRLNFNTPVSGLVSFVSVSGQVAASEFLPPGSMGMELPSGLEKGVYALRTTSANHAVERIVIE